MSDDAFARMAFLGFVVLTWVLKTLPDVRTFYEQQLLSI